MTADTYIICVTFADGSGTGTDYESVVGRAYATARKNAAFSALRHLRNEREPAKRISIGVWGSESHCPYAMVDLEPTYTGDFRGVVSALKYAEETENYPYNVTGRTVLDS